MKENTQHEKHAIAPSLASGCSAAEIIEIAEAETPPPFHKYLRERQSRIRAEIATLEAEWVDIDVMLNKENSR